MEQKIQHNLIESLIDIVTHQLEILTPYSHKLHLKIINHLRPEFKAELFQYQITNAENN